MHDQLGQYTTNVKTGAEGEKMLVHSFLRVEAIVAMLALVRAADPLETLDRVQMLHRIRYEQQIEE